MIRMVHDHGALTGAIVSRHRQCDAVADAHQDEL
jgi:hypothetical protein